MGNTEINCINELRADVNDVSTFLQGDNNNIIIQHRHTLTHSHTQVHNSMFHSRNI